MQLIYSTELLLFLIKISENIEVFTTFKDSFL
jgi:hypothetical protein